jgi:hypothetical protein
LENRAFPQRGAIVRIRWKRKVRAQGVWQKHIGRAEEDLPAESCSPASLKARYTTSMRTVPWLEAIEALIEP